VNVVALSPEIAFNCSFSFPSFFLYPSTGHLPLIVHLRNPGMKPRHWKKISERIGRTVVPSDMLSLMQLLEMGFSDHIPFIKEISEQASREYSLERAIDRMQNYWRHASFQFLEVTRAGSHVLAGVEDIMSTLDEHIVRTQTIRGHPSVKPIEDRAKRWEARLNMAQVVLEEWLACQRQWLYLEPVFSSLDIQSVCCFFSY
jgi:dynein heavy chain, axonemal